MDVPLAVAVPWFACVEMATVVAAPPVIWRVIASLLELAATLALTALATGAMRLTAIDTVAAADVPPALDASFERERDRRGLGFQVDGIGEDLRLVPRQRAHEADDRVIAAARLELQANRRNAAGGLIGDARRRGHAGKGKAIPCHQCSHPVLQCRSSGIGPHPTKGVRRIGVGVSRLLQLRLDVAERRGRPREPRLHVARVSDL